MDQARKAPEKRRLPQYLGYGAAGIIPVVVILVAISVMAAYPINEDRFRHTLREIAERRATRGSNESSPRDDNAG